MSTATTVIDELDWAARPTDADIAQDPASSLSIAEAWLAQVARALDESITTLYDGHAWEVEWVFQEIACLDTNLPAVPLTRVDEYVGPGVDPEWEAWNAWLSKYLKLVGTISHIRSRMAASSIRVL